MQQSERAAVQLLHGCTRDLVLSSAPLPPSTAPLKSPFARPVPVQTHRALPPSRPLSSGPACLSQAASAARSALPACHMASATVGRAALFKRAKNTHKRVADIKNPPFTHRLKGRLVFMQTGTHCGPAPRRAELCACLCLCVHLISSEVQRAESYPHTCWRPSGGVEGAGEVGFCK